MIKHPLAKVPALLLTLAVSLIASSSAFGSVTIVIQNADVGATGFNDNTPVAPVGGNNGTTLGQQRLNAFQFAANIWGATLNSGPSITVNASWEAMSCSQNSGVLGSAGNVTIRRNFANAPFQNTWYGVSLANALSGTDLNPGNAEIDAQFNVNIGTVGCLQASPWYLGLDSNHGDGIDLVTVLLHEFSHGLGFQTFTNSSTGVQNQGFPSIYDRFLRNNSTGKLWIDMTDGERVASAINSGNLSWAGSQVTADVPNVLGTPRLRVNPPAAIAGNYVVGTAEFGPKLTSPGVTNDVAQASPTDGCATIGSSVSGKIAFINRGDCNFTVKVKNAQNAGATGVIIANVASSPNPGIPPGMAGSDSSISIPSVSLSLADGNTVRAQLGSSVNATIFLDHSVFSGADSSNRALMFAPNPVDLGSSVAHFDVTAFPNLLMEPNNADDLTHSVVPPQDLTLSLLRDLGWPSGTVALPTVQLTASTFSVNEGGTTLSVGVSRAGDASGASAVDYATTDNAGSNTCNLLTNQASSRCDYLTTLGKLTFAAGETSKTISIPIVNDTYAEGSETFTITLSNVTGATLNSPSTATLTITDNEGVNGPNPIDTTNFFVRQHYIDFLNREPDGPGLTFWSDQITSCGADPNCIEIRRINVSAAFFLSIEFQETGYLVYRTYKSGFGNLGGAPVPVSFNEFLRDTQEIGKGVQVGAAGWEAQLEANKQAYAVAFVQRPDFLVAFPNSLTAQQIVNQLNTNAGGVLSVSEQATLVGVLGGTPADATKRASVLRSVAEDGDLKSAEFNKAFVLMQYFGYLRRNANAAPNVDFSGFDFWLGKLNSFGGNFVQAEMVKAFILSGEYRQRFGP